MMNPGRQDDDLTTEGSDALFQPASFFESLMAWTFILKDLLKRVLIALEECELMLGSLRFLEVHDTRARSDGLRSHVPRGLMFRRLRENLVHQALRLRALREDLRDELIVIELFVLRSQRYTDLTIPIDRHFHANTEGGVISNSNTPLVVRNPPLDGKTLASAYAFAVRIIGTTKLASVIESAQGLLSPRASQIRERFRKAFWPNLEPQCWTDQSLLKIYHPDPSEWNFVGTYFLPFVLEENVFQRSWIDERLRDCMAKKGSTRRSTERCESAMAKVWGDWLEARWHLVVNEAFSNEPNVEDHIELATAVGDFGDLFRKNEELRRTLFVDLLTIAQICWEERRSQVLEQVAELRTGEAPEIYQDRLHPVHEHLFRRVGRFHQRLNDSMDAMRTTFRSIQQRSSVLPPSFPQVPRFHRREREAIITSLQSTMDRINDRTIDVTALFRSRPAKLNFDFAMSYIFTSRILPLESDHLRRPEVGPGDATPPSILVLVPFFFIELPRHFINLAHEVAHAYLPTHDVEKLLGDDIHTWRTRAEAGGWNTEVAEEIRWAGWKLRQLYDTSGTWRSTSPESELLSEMLADFVALLTSGPYFVLSLLFTTVGFLRLPRRPGMPDEDVSSEPISVSPMVRVAVLLRMIEFIREEDGWGDKQVGWSVFHVTPVRALVRSYFGLLAGYGQTDFRERTALDLFGREVEIMSDLLERLFKLIQEGDRRCWVRPVETGEHPEVHELWKGVDGICLGETGQAARDKEKTEAILGFATAGEAATEPRPAEDNILHFLWYAMAESFYRDSKALVESTTPDEKRRHIERALWTRVPEVRPLLQLLDRGQRLDDATLKKVVTVRQANLFWSANGGRCENDAGGGIYDAWCSLKDWPDDAWCVIGSHDYHSVITRYAEKENLDRPVARSRALVPLTQSLSYVRALDYEVIGSEEDVVEPEKEELEMGMVGAFVQLRLSPDEEKLSATEALLKAVQESGVELDLPIMGSVAWDHNAVRIRYSRFSELGRFLSEVKSRLRIQNRVTELLFRPSMDPKHLADHPHLLAKKIRKFKRKQALNTGDTVTFVSRIRCLSHLKASAIESAGKALEDLFEAVVPQKHKAFSMHFSAKTGLDDYELRLSVEGLDYGKGRASTVLELLATLSFTAAKKLEAVDVVTDAVFPWRRFE